MQFRKIMFKSALFTSYKIEYICERKKKDEKGCGKPKPKKKKCHIWLTEIRRFCCFPFKKANHEQAER